MTSTANLSDAFNPFLFATVCEGRNEMPVSVVSALARLDIDPWMEAAELASMPAVGATERLSSLLAGVAGGPAAQPDRDTIAARLIGLLPAPLKTDAKAGAGTANALASPYVQSLAVMWLIILASMAASAWSGAQAPTAGAHGAPAKPVPPAVAGR